MSVMIIVSIIISLIIVMGSFYLNTQPGHFDKLSPYECGFEPETPTTGGKFYLNFYMIAIIFLIFDLEVILLFPLTVIGLSPNGFVVFLSFMAVLILGIVLEYKKLNTPENIVQTPTI